MTTTHDLIGAGQHRAYLREQLIVQFPVLAEDETALVDTLDGISDLKEMLVAVMRTADEDEMLVGGIEAREAELKERRERLAKRIATKREIVCRVMERADLKKIEAPEFTLSLRNIAGSVVITDETKIPADYMRTPEPPAPQPDKKKIGGALKANTEVPGALLSNGGVGLSVRKK